MNPYGDVMPNGDLIVEYGEIKSKFLGVIPEGVWSKDSVTVSSRTGCGRISMDEGVCGGAITYCMSLTGVEYWTLMTGSCDWFGWILFAWLLTMWLV